MKVEPATLRTYPLPQIVAYCLSDMTFHGFSEAENRAEIEELRGRVAEIEAKRPQTDPKNQGPPKRPL